MKAQQMIPGRMWLMAVAVAVISVSCASSSPIPTETNPIPMCQIECKGGAAPRMGAIHLCPSGHWYRDFLAVAEYIVRGADGGKITDAWVSKDGAVYPKVDVERGVCSTAIMKLVPDLALHPGEEKPSYPSSSPPQ